MKLVIIGASGHGKVLADIASLVGYDEIVFLDRDTRKKYCGNYPVVGDTTDYSKFRNDDFVIGIGDSKIRQSIQSKLEEAGCNVISLIHPSAIIAKDSVINAGTVVMAGAVINSGVNIGKGVIVNTCASVDHDCEIHDFVHISVGSHLAGTVFVERNTFIGAGETIINKIGIKESCTIGAGAVVIRDIEKSGTYVGVPAKLI